MIDINLIPDHLRKTRRNKALSAASFRIPQEMVIGLAGGLIFLLILIHSVLLVVSWMKTQQYAKLKKQWEEILPAKQRVDAVLKEGRILSNKIDAIDKVTTGKKVSWAQKLNDISDNLPRGVWLNKVSVGQKVLLIDGSAVSRTKEEMTNVGNFASNLKSCKTFMKGLENIELGSIQRRSVKSVEIVDFLITVRVR